MTTIQFDDNHIPGIDCEIPVSSCCGAYEIEDIGICGKCREFSSSWRCETCEAEMEI